MFGRVSVHGFHSTAHGAKDIDRLISIASEDIAFERILNLCALFSHI